MYRTDEWCLMKSGLFYSGKESTRLRMIFCKDCNVNGSHNYWGGFPQRPKSASLAFFRWDTILCQALDLSLKWMGCDNRRTQPLVTNTFSFPDPLWCENKALYRPSETGTLNCVSVCVCKLCTHLASLLRPTTFLLGRYPMWTYRWINTKTFIYYALQLIEKNPLTSQRATLYQAQTNDSKVLYYLSHTQSYRV